MSEERSSSRWQRLRVAFERARELTGSQRAEFVASTLRDDPELRAELLTLLGHGEALGGFLEGQVAGWLAGQRVAEFRILRELGRGGMGIVYLAEQERPRRQVALKALHPFARSPRAVRRFQHETAVLARLLHPGIAQIYASGTAPVAGEEVPWFAMELVEGENLVEHAARQGLSPRERAALFVPICEAVQHAHGRGVVHRDLKPANLLVTAAGEPKVLDFGVARSTEADLRRTTLATEAGMLVGTLPYMSPEQLEGNAARIDARSDVYALGVVLYELLTGSLPYRLEGLGLAEALRLLREAEPVPPSRHVRGLAGDLETIVLTALRKDPARRYPSAAALARDLASWLEDQPIAARPPSRLYYASKFARRNPGLVLGSSAAFLALIVGLAGTSWQYVRAAQSAVLAREAESAARREAGKYRDVNLLLGRLFLSPSPGVEGRDVRVVDVLRGAAAELRGAYEQDPEVEASLRMTLGESLQALGFPEEARDQFELALPLFQRSVGEDHRGTVLALSNLGGACALLGELDRAEELLGRALARAREVFGPRHRTTLLAELNAAGLLHARGLAAEALEAYEQLVAVAREVLGEEDELVLGALDQMAVIQAGQGRLSDSRASFERILDARRRVLSEDHPSTLKTLHDLATALHREARFEEAIALLREVAERMAGALGPDHRARARALGDLGAGLRDLGRLEEGRAVLEEALASQRRSLPADHRETLQTANQLGVLWMYLRDLERAGEIFRETHAARLRTLGAPHPDTLQSAFNLIAVLRERGELERAEHEARALLAARPEGPGHPQRLEAQSLLAQILLDRAMLGDDEGQAREALELGRDVLRVHEERLSPGHPDTAMSQNLVGQALLLLGEPAAAESLFRQARETLASALSPAHAQSLAMLNNLAQSLVRQGRTADAIEMMEEGLEQTLAAHGEEQPLTVLWLMNLASARLALGERSAAAELAARGVDLARRVHGADHPTTARFEDLARRCSGD